LINRTPTTDRSVLFKLEGNKSNKAAIGARVKIKAGDMFRIAEVKGGSSYLSQNDLRLHFGLGQNSSVSEVEIAWPSGKRDQFRNLVAGFIYTIVEGGMMQKAPLAEQPAKSVTPEATAASPGR